MNRIMYKIVVLHGWGHNRKYWNEFQNRFPSNEVITIDLPGFGDEKKVSDDWGIPEYAQWVKKKIEAMHTENVILLGHSFGGRITAYIASEQPEWLKAIILYAAPVIYRPKLKIKVQTMLAKSAKKLGIRTKLKINKELIEADKYGLGKLYRKAVPFDQTKLLFKVKVPTLLLWGKNDSEEPVQNAEEVHTLIPNSKLVILDNLGHNVHLENPNLFYGTIKNFIKNL